MKRLAAAALCVTCTGPLWAQQEISPIMGNGNFIFRSYQPKQVPAARLGNSTRFAALVRGGKLYLDSAGRHRAGAGKQHRYRKQPL